MMMGNGNRKERWKQMYWKGKMGIIIAFIYVWPATSNFITRPVIYSHVSI